MTDWDQLREIGHQVSPPPYDSLVSTAGKRARRARIITATATLTLLAALGFGTWLVDDDEGGIVQPAQSPSDGSVTVSDGVLPLPEPEDGEEPGPLDAGRYHIPLSETLALEVDLPQNTIANSEGLYLELEGSLEGSILKVENAGDEYGVPIDPCTDQSVEPVGPTVQDLVDAIRDQPIYRVSRPEPVKVGGAEGTYLEIRIPTGYDSTPCEGSQVGMPGNPSTSNNMPPGHVGDWWILGVDGQRAVVQHFCEQCDADATDHVAKTVQSITFTPTP